MGSIDLRSLNLTIEESRDINNFIAQKRGISTEKLLSTIKPNLKRKNSEILTIKTQQNMVKLKKNTTKHGKNTTKHGKTKKNTTKYGKTKKNTTKHGKTQQNMAKTRQKLRKSKQNMAKTQQKLRKSQQNMIKTQQNMVKTQQNLIKSPKAQQKSLKLGKCKNTQNLTYEKPSKLAKLENLTS